MDSLQFWTDAAIERHLSAIVAAMDLLERELTLNRELQDDARQELERRAKAAGRYEAPAEPGSHLAIHQSVRRLTQQHGFGFFSCATCGYDGFDDDPLSDLGH